MLFAYAVVNEGSLWLGSCPSHIISIMTAAFIIVITRLALIAELDGSILFRG